ncbi:TlpA disulfide reductase family protein [Mesonia sp. HuA40]|uniref:TlpA family protein disulfide reductase n=1 Tax=Mesonia sp. HuA40 TaxID=2602761 RepID=UPI0011C9CFA0|nr:TlpA disulfide reductase family protein [Mesonia sp. HuA40]TXK75074.1 TlpA family protein disulfide reductase [Mesonia sp. HuA40]
MKNPFILFSIILLSYFNSAHSQSKVEEFLSLSNLELIKEGQDVFEIKLPDKNGKEYNLNNLEGKYILINFWATWCAPCVKNLPFFENLVEKHKTDNIEFVFVSLDKTKEKWIKYISEKEMKGIQLFAPEGDKTRPICYFLNRIYLENDQIKSIEKGIPRYVLIDPKGKIIRNDLEKSSKKEIEDILNKQLNK